MSSLLFSKRWVGIEIIHCIGVDENSSMIPFTLQNYRRIFVEIFVIIVNQIAERLIELAIGDV